MYRPNIRLSCRLSVALFIVPAALPLLGSGTSGFDECDCLVREEPGLSTSYECYEDVARTDGSFDEAVRRLEALLQIHPDRHYAWSVLGTIARHRGEPRAEELFHRAAALAEESGDLTGVLKARASLGTLLRRQGRLDEAEVELQHALAAAEANDSPAQMAYVWMKQGWLARDRYDYGLAKRLFLQAEAAIFPDGPDNLQASVLAGLGSICWRLGQDDLAFRYHERTAELARQRGDLYGEATARFNMASAAHSRARLDEIELEQAARLTRVALEAALKVGNRQIEARARLMLAELGVGDDLRSEYEEIRRLCEKIGDWQGANQALRFLGAWYVESGPEGEAEGFRLLDKAVAEARAMGGGIPLYRSLYHRAEELYTAGRPREEWKKAYQELLAEMERLRELQPEARVRARTFSRFSGYFYTFARRLLETLDSATSPGDDLDLAFRTVERMEARLLLDSLEAAGAEPLESDAEGIESERREVLRELAEVQTELMHSELDDDARTLKLDELKTLEQRDDLLRLRLADVRTGGQRGFSSAIASIKEVQARLDDDRALISYQVSGYEALRERRFEGSLISWMFVITAERANVFPLPDYFLLDKQIRFYNGLLRKRDGSEAAAARRLERDLLEKPLLSLPDGIRRLVIVPDGPLSGLAFGTLRSDDGRRLAERFEITYAPSATLWTRWQEKHSGGGELLAFADPEVGEEGNASAQRDVDPWLDGLRLGPLPHARREAETVLRQLGKGEVLTGPDASEEQLKQVDLGRVGILHFATHAVVDEERPDRSAVVLATGSGSDDGLLQVREIVDLQLDNQLVILTGCRSASGRRLAGEGVLSLAHAFFQSGARAVIASLWPLRDDETARLMKLMAKRLSHGASIAEALTWAQREMIASGKPAASWSGLVVLGDGDLVPLPGGSSFGSRGLPLALTCLAVLILLGLAVLIRRRKARG